MDRPGGIPNIERIAETESNEVYQTISRSVAEVAIHGVAEIVVKIRDETEASDRGEGCLLVFSLDGEADVFAEMTKDGAVARGLLFFNFAPRVQCGGAGAAIGG